MPIKVTETPLPGVVVIDPQCLADERGFFLESWNQRAYADAGLPAMFVQDNHSRSRQGVLRGLHYQDMRAPMGKLVRCTLGRIFDVAVDLRVGAPSFGRGFGVELSAESKWQIYVPPGFAHGLVALTDVVEVQYKQTALYAPDAERVLAWDDLDVGVAWPAVGACAVGARSAGRNAQRVPEASRIQARGSEAASEMTPPLVLPRGLQAAEHRAVLAAGDACAATAAVLVALWLWSIPAGSHFSPGFLADHAWWFAAAALWLVVASFPAAPADIAFSLRRTLAMLARGAAILLIAYGGWYFVAPRGVLPRLVVLYFVWEATLLTLAWRLIFVTVFSREPFRQRAIIVGSGRAAALALSTIQVHRGRQVDVVGVVPDPGDAGPGLDLTMVDAHRLLEVAAERGVSELVLALAEPPSPELLTTLRLCQEAGAQVVRVQTLTEQVLQRVPVDSGGGGTNDGRAA